MELLKWTLFYLSLMTISVVLAIIGWKLGGKLKIAKKNARHNKDLKVIQEFQDTDEV